MSVNKVKYNNMQSDTVTTQSLLQGYTAVDRTGALITGAYTSLKTQLIVVTEDGNSVSVSQGTVQVTTGTSDGGACLFELPGYGTYQVTVSLNGITKNATISVTEVKQYVVKLTVIGTLEETSWGVIKTVSQAGNAQNYWAV